MTVDDRDSAMSTLRAAVIAVEGRLPSSDVDNIWEFIEVGELGLALETLCTQLYEYDVAVSAKTLAGLADVGRFFLLKPRLWEVLEQET